MPAEFKPLKVEDFKLTPQEMAELVEGAQKFFPPQPEDFETASTPAAED